MDDPEYLSYEEVLADFEFGDGWQLIVGQEYDHSQVVEEMYERITCELAAIGPPWVPEGVLGYPIPVYDGDESMATSFDKEKYQTPLESFVLNISNRSRTGPPMLPAMSRDYLVCTYGKLPDTRDYRHVVTSVFPRFVATMNTRHGYITNDRVRDEDWLKDNFDDYLPPAEELLKRVDRIWDANFWSDRLCRSAFGCTAQEVVSRLKDEVAEARLFHGGALILCSYEEPSADEVRALDGRLRPLLSSWIFDHRGDVPGG